MKAELSELVMDVWNRYGLEISQEAVRELCEELTKKYAIEGVKPLQGKCERHRVTGEEQQVVGGVKISFLDKAGSDQRMIVMEKRTGEEWPLAMTGEQQRIFQSGAVRDTAEGKGRFDLMPLGVVGQWLNDDILRALDGILTDRDPKRIFHALELFAGQEGYSLALRLGRVYEDGAKHYGERNWEKGIPVESFLDSGVRHYLQHRSGITDERHDLAFIWNMVALAWTVQGPVQGPVQGTCGT